MTRTRRRSAPARRAAAATVAATAAGVSLLSAGAGSAQAADASAAGAYKHYVALGDSYAAGTGLPQATNDTCKRSTSSYASLLAATYKPAVFKDVTCSGATTKSLWNKQGPQAPQVNALTKDTDLVTVTLGGNDLGFTETLTQCVVASQLGNTCKASVAKTLDAKLDYVASRTRDMITDISRRSPNARIVLVGYPRLFPADGSRCAPYKAQVPLAASDVAYLDQVTRELNVTQALVAHQAKTEGKKVTYADTYSAFTDAHMCQSDAAKRWINPVLTPNASTGKLTVTSGSAHPNGVGHLMMGRKAYQVLQG